MITVTEVDPIRTLRDEKGPSAMTGTSGQADRRMQICRSQVLGRGRCL
jgi:hypothetical protein